MKAVTPFAELDMLAVYLLLFVPVIIYFILPILYNLWFHPLSRYPGPVLARSTNLWYIRSMLNGTLPYDILELHQTYGDIIRIRPHELVFNRPEAWKQIYGHKPGRSEIPKDPELYNRASGGNLEILGAPEARHAELRRLLSAGFSDKSLREQEVTFQKYAAMFLDNLRRCCIKGRTVVNMVKWYNFYTFDVVGDLAYGESFDCLATGQYHPWIECIFEHLKSSAYTIAMSYYPMLRPIFGFFIPNSVMEGRKLHRQLSQEKAERRKRLKEQRHDLVAKMAADGSGISMPEFSATTAVLILAGSDTIASVLSGVTYFLVNNPQKLKKLVHEIRTAFTSDDQITFLNLNKLNYIQACLDEAQRLYPAIAGNSVRKTEQIETILGEQIPPNTAVSTCQFAMYRTSRFFTRPTEFIPERWLGKAEFANDKRAAFQPFNVGPRDCLGRNMATIEMRLILATLLFNFDIESTLQCDGWLDQKSFTLWAKGPLMIRLTRIR